MSQTPDLKEQIGNVIANVSSLPGFVKQSQQIYNALKGIDDADKTNQQNYGVQRWDSSRALPVVYSVMQDVVNITNDVNNVMQRLQILNTYNEQEFSPIFAILQSQQLSDKQGTLDQKRTELEPLRHLLEQASSALKEQFENVQSGTPSVESLDSFKKSVRDLNIQINTNSGSTKANSNLILGYVNSVNPDN